MGNFLCFSRPSGREQSKPPKKKKSFIRCFFRENAVAPDSATIATDASKASVINEQKEFEQDITDSNAQNVSDVTKVNPEIKVVPVVSNSILLRHFDGDSDCENESEVRDENVAPITNITNDAGSADELPSSDNKKVVTKEGSTASVKNRNVLKADVPTESDNKEDVRPDEAIISDYRNDMKADKPIFYDNANDVLSSVSKEDVKADDLTPSDNKVVGADRLSSSDNKSVLNTDKVSSTVNELVVKKDEPCSIDKEVGVKAERACSSNNKEVFKTDESLSADKSDTTRKAADRSEDELIDAEVASGRIVRVKPVDSSSKSVCVDSICGSRGNETSTSTDKEPKYKIGQVSPVYSAALTDVKKVAKQHIATRNVSPVTVKYTTPTEMGKVCEKLPLGSNAHSTQQEDKAVKVLKIELKKVSPDQSGGKNENTDVISTNQQNLEDHIETQQGTSTTTPEVPKQLDAAAMLDHTKGLRALSAHNLSSLIDSNQKQDKPKVSSKNVFAPQPGTSESYGGGAGFYQSRDGIQKWLKHSASEPATSVSYDNDFGTSDDNGFPQRVVSDFMIPKKPARKPPKPLTLKKEIPHLYGIPGIAKSDLLAGKKSQTWTQKDYQGPMAAAMWTTKPTSYDVKFPPLPKRLLDREGSIDKLRNAWVLPQIKQIETLKRECGRYPGLKVPCSKRGSMYSVNIEVPSCSKNCANTDDDDEDKDNDKNDTAASAEEKGASSN